MKELAKALIESRKNMGKLVKDKTNPHFKSKYATLKAVIETAQGPFQDAGLCVFEYTDCDGEGITQWLTVFHTESGESMESSLPLNVRDPLNPQQVGSAQTYARRYLWTAAAGLAPEDDDGNAAAQGKPAFKPAGKPVDHAKSKSAIDERKSFLASELKRMGVAAKDQKAWICQHCDHYEESGQLSLEDIDKLLDVIGHDKRSA